MKHAILYLLVLVVAAPASAQVALVLQMKSRDPVHRDYVAGVVGEANERWDRLQAPLDAKKVRSCKAEDRCLLVVARDAGASHLVVVGLSELGGTDFVVVLRVLDADGKVLASYNDLATPGRDPRMEGTRVARDTFDKAAGVPIHGPPILSVEDKTERPIILENVPYSGLSLLSASGWSFVGLGVATFGVGSALTFSAFAPPPTPASSQQALDMAILSMPIAAGLCAVGAALLTADAFVSHADVPAESPAESLAIAVATQSHE